MLIAKIYILLLCYIHLQKKITKRQANLVPQRQHSWSSVLLELDIPHYVLDPL